MHRRSYNRFTLSQISAFMSEDVGGLSDDDGDVLPPFFREQVDTQLLPVVDWFAKEFASVKERSSRVVNNSILYLESKKMRRDVMPNTKPPPVDVSLPSMSKTKSKQKKRSNPPKGRKESGNSKGKHHLLIWTGKNDMWELPQIQLITCQKQRYSLPCHHQHHNSLQFRFTFTWD